MSKQKPTAKKRAQKRTSTKSPFELVVEHTARVTREKARKEGMDIDRYYARLLSSDKENIDKEVAYILLRAFTVIVVEELTGTAGGAR